MVERAGAGPQPPACAGRPSSRNAAMRSPDKPLQAPLLRFLSPSAHEAALRCPGAPPPERSRFGVWSALAVLSPRAGCPQLLFCPAGREKPGRQTPKPMHHARPCPQVIRRRSSSRAAYQACAARTARPCPRDRTRAALVGFTPYAVLILSAGHRGVVRHERPTCRFPDVRLDCSCRGIGRVILTDNGDAADRGTSTAASGFFPAGSPPPASARGDTALGFASSRSSDTASHAGVSRRGAHELQLT